MLKVGITGLGFMGWIHWLAYQKVDGIQVAAVCEQDPKKLTGDWTDIQGNFGPAGEQVDLSNVATYSSYDEMLADDSLDLIDICLPPSLHAPFTIKAAQAGKHVFSEKPMSLKLDACNDMVSACRDNNVQLMVGHVLPFFAEYTHALNVIRSGEYGSLLGGYFKRVISDPHWLNNFYDPDKIGGPMLDLHVHDAHFIRLLFGMPTSVTSRGRMRGEVVEYCSSLFGFEDSRIVVNSIGGVVNQQGRPFTHGFEIHLEKATMHFEFGAYSDNGESAPFKICTHDDKVIRPELPGGDEVDSFAAEIREVVRAIKSGQPSDILGGDLAMDAIRICQWETESVKSGKTISA
jgi:predicted dehydrogenase